MPFPFVIAQGFSTTVIFSISAVLFVVVLIFVAIFARFISLWIQCKMTGAGRSAGCHKTCEC